MVADDPPKPLMERRFPPDPSSVPASRYELAAFLEERGVPAERIELATLLTSELVTNAILHAGTSVVLSAAVLAGTLRVEVGDGSTALPRMRAPGGPSGGGWGLHVVDDLATRWAVEPLRAGKKVWFELNDPSPGSV